MKIYWKTNRNNYLSEISVMENRRNCENFDNSSLVMLNLSSLVFSLHAKFVTNLIRFDLNRRYWGKLKNDLIALDSSQHFVSKAYLLFVRRDKINCVVQHIIHWNHNQLVAVVVVVIYLCFDQTNLIGLCCHPFLGRNLPISRNYK